MKTLNIKLILDIDIDVEDEVDTGTVYEIENVIEDEMSKFENISLNNIEIEDYVEV